MRQVASAPPEPNLISVRRYTRHIVLPHIGEAGQHKLLQSAVLVIGAGGLGAAAIGNLAAMGVGTIGVADEDRVELSNLNRQLLYETGDIGRLKVEAAADSIHELNPDVQLVTHPLRVTAKNAESIIRDYQLVLDGSDNFATRFAVHDACYTLKRPLISAALSGFNAQISTFKAYLGAPHPCYRCYISETPEGEINCEQEGIIGALAVMMGSMQALEAVKELLNIGESLSGTLLHYDALKSAWRESTLTKDASCKLCCSSS